MLAAEIVEDLQAALEQFREIAEDLGEEGVSDLTSDLSISGQGDDQSKRLEF